MTRAGRLVALIPRGIADTTRRIAGHLQHSLGLTIEHHRNVRNAWWSTARLGDHPRPGDRGRVFALVHVSDMHNMETLEVMESRWRFYFRVGPKGFARKRQLEVDLNYEIVIPNGRWHLHICHPWSGDCAMPWGVRLNISTPWAFIHIGLLEGRVQKLGKDGTYGDEWTWLSVNPPLPPRQ